MPGQLNRYTHSLDVLYLKTLMLKKESINEVLISVSFTKGIDKIISKNDLRKKFYEEGFYIDNKHYVRYKRSAGSSRIGKCLFILEKYYNKMNKWSNCGLKENSKYIKNNLVAYEAYKALSLSSLEFIINIDPKSILVMDDYEVTLNEKAIGVDIKNGKLTASKQNEIKIKNNIWDGQGLLDSSIFEQNGLSNKGMMLLRNRYFKCCVFNTNLKKFFEDYKDKLPKDGKLNGYMYDGKNINDIKLIVTKSSLKYLKLCEDNNESIKKWMDTVGDTFGVVKCDKPTQLFKGDMVYTSYQLLNTLGLNKEEASSLVEPFLHFRDLIRNDFDIFRFYVENSSFKKDGSGVDKDDSISTSSYTYRATVCQKLSFINTDFQYTEEYKTYMSDLTTSFRTDALLGNLMIEGTNATLFGNGYEMLLNTIFKFNPNECLLQNGEIYCKKFANNETLVGARSPHITMGNLLLVKNKYIDVIDKYFNLSNEIVLVDAINNNIQQKLNGCDYDSDFILLTNNKTILNAVSRNYSNFLVPVCLASPKEKVKSDLFMLDSLISDNKVGEIVNLSQRLNSIYWNLISQNEDEEALNIYLDICKLAVLSGMEIDKAKRIYDVDVAFELSSITTKIKENYSKKPMFFYYINKFSRYGYSYVKKEDEKYKRVLNIKREDYQYYKTGMDYIVQVVNESKLPQTRTEFIPLSNLVNLYNAGGSIYAFANELLEDIKELHHKIQSIRKLLRSPNSSQESIIDHCMIEINNVIENLNLRKQLANPKTLYALINKLELENNFSIRYLILYILLEDKRRAYEEVFIKKHPKEYLCLTNEITDIQIFDKFYKKVA